MSTALDNARRIGAALTESELPSEAELRRVVAGLIYSYQENVELLNDDDVAREVTALRRLHLPQAQQFDADATVVAEPASADADARIASLEKGQETIIALLQQRNAPEQPEPFGMPAEAVQSIAPQGAAPTPSLAVEVDHTPAPETATAPGDPGTELGQSPAGT